MRHGAGGVQLIMVLKRMVLRHTGIQIVCIAFVSYAGFCEAGASWKLVVARVDVWFRNKLIEGMESASIPGSWQTIFF
jgi:hypothetical protein